MAYLYKQVSMSSFSDEGAADLNNTTLLSGWTNEEYSNA